MNLHAWGAGTTAALTVTELLTRVTDGIWGDTLLIGARVRDEQQVWKHPFCLV